MEEDQELKHVCKFCNKSFPCGRSLGGHMRSHVINSADQTGEKRHKKKLSSVNNGGSNAISDMGIEGGAHTGYGLRENPKKTCRFADSSEDTLLHGKFCKDCGKGFQSWKALYGHMKCHSERFSNTSVDEDSWTTSANQKLVMMDSQSDNNEAVAPNRRKRSKRVTRYMATTTTSSSFSIANASSSVSEIGHEQEELAMCLMMLSRDVGFNSVVAESSDNNSDFLEAQIEGKNSVCDGGGEVVKFKKLRNGKLESTVLVSENSQLEVPINGFLGNDKFNKSQVELGSKKGSSTSSKRKCQDLFEKSSHGVSKNRFECTTCNKTFHSYQALGGHRASHKKIKGCFASKNENSNDDNIDHELVTGNAEMGKSKGHECPICFKVFSSGQALGGHKRSHLIGVPEARSNQTVVIQKPIPDLLDLNLPAPVEEESNGFNPWWVGSSHKHEPPLVGLISN